MYSEISMKTPNAVGNFLWNLSTHPNYGDQSSESQKTQHERIDLREKSARKNHTERDSTMIITIT